MNYDTLLFDLDGTISDPLEGIGRSINHALDHFGYSQIPMDEIAQHIGVPLDGLFRLFSEETADETILPMVDIYRERYIEVGYAENELYPEMPEILRSLTQSGMCMGICTSKRKDYATKIVEMFGLLDCFEFVSGGDVGISKAQQIEDLVRDGLASANSLMIGDRAVDLTSGHANGLGAAGVLWGFGSREELEKENPRHLFSEPEELLELKA